VEQFFFDRAILNTKIIECREMCCICNVGTTMRTGENSVEGRAVQLWVRAFRQGGDICQENCVRYRIP
jgi:hypothetical protein